jgi:hypothetical protein
MYAASPSAGERFYLRLLLTVVKGRHHFISMTLSSQLTVFKGATSYENLRTVDGAVCNTFKDACRLRGLLDDDGEWIQCLQEAKDMCTGSHLRNLFVIIMVRCNPTSPHQLWDHFKVNVCDDLRNRLMHPPMNIPQPTEEEVYDYGLYLIDGLLRKNSRTLDSYPLMPVPQMAQRWGIMEGNQLIAEQLRFHLEGNLQEFVDAAVPTLNEDQRRVYHAVVDDARVQGGHAYFVHSAGGCGKTYLCNLIAATLRAEGKIVLCVASSGIASLLLTGGRTAHSRLKIPIPIHEGSMCYITKGDDLHKLLERTCLIICDEIPMLHRHILESLDRTLRDLLGVDDDFGGITMLFGGDFRQTLPVVPHGSREQIVGATFCRSRLWQYLQVFQLKTNMRLGQDPASDHFAQWLLEIGAGRNTDADGTVTLPEHMRCGNNDIQSLINALYSDLFIPDHPPLADSYFLDRTILSSKNTDVDEINSSILDLFPGEKIIFTSADSVVDNLPEYNYLPIEFLHTLTPSGFPLHKLELKIGAPLMLLRNLDPTHGLYNGTRMILVSHTTRILRCRVLRQGNDGVDHADENTVLIPRMNLELKPEENPIPLKRRQFPVRLSFAMTINKAQGQSVKWVGLNLRTPVFSHGQLYVGLSRCTHPDRVFAIFPEHEEGTKTTNVVYTEVLGGLNDL